MMREQFNKSVHPKYPGVPGSAPCGLMTFDLLWLDGDMVSW
jgi:hypothetical protein